MNCPNSVVPFAAHLLSILHVRRHSFLLYRATLAVRASAQSGGLSGSQRGLAQYHWYAHGHHCFARQSGQGTAHFRRERAIRCRKTKQKESEGATRRPGLKSFRLNLGLERPLFGTLATGKDNWIHTLSALLLEQ